MNRPSTSPHPVQTSAPLRARGEELARHLPPLLARAEELAAGVILGEHGRRKPGLGDAFWQYRPAMAGDPARAIDWRRSARSDQHFVQEKEWQGSQAVTLWVDAAASMHFASRSDVEPKQARAALLALAVGILLIRAGERVGLGGADEPPMRGEAQLGRIAAALERARGAPGAASPQGDETAGEYGSPGLERAPANSRALLVSDFFGDPGLVEECLGRATDRGITGALLQVLDPAEEAFPFRGRTIFESPGHALRHETQKARDLRARYLDRLAQRKEALAAMARNAGWHFHVHHTADAPQGALLWLYHALEARG